MRRDTHTRVAQWRWICSNVKNRQFAVTARFLRAWLGDVL